MSVLGKPLERLPTMFVKECGYVPTVLTNAAFVIEKNIRAKGLFQVQGNLAKVNACLNLLLAPRLSKIKSENVHDVVEALKAFLVHLPEPLLPEHIVQALMCRSTHQDLNLQYTEVLTGLHNSSPHCFAILHFLMQLLKKISEHSADNSMDVRKLATVFVLDVIKPFQSEDAAEGAIVIERMQRLPYLIMVVESLINKVDIFKSIANVKAGTPSCKGSGVSVNKSSGRNSPKTSRSNTTDVVDSNFTMRNDSRDLLQDPPGDEDTEKQFAEPGVHLQTHQDQGWTKKADWTQRFGSEPRRKGFDFPDVTDQLFAAYPAPVIDTDLKISLPTESAGRAELVLKQNAVEVRLAPSKLTPQLAVEKGDKKLTSKSVMNFERTKFALNEGKRTITGGSQLQGNRKRPIKKEKDEAANNTGHVFGSKGKGGTSANTPIGKKRKSRSTSRKRVGQGKHPMVSRAASDDFAAFRPDEEITPWNEWSSKSEDSSIMVKTIRNPRVLAFPASASAHPCNQREISQYIKGHTTPDKVSHIFLTNSGFRTISRQQTTSSSDHKSSDDWSSSSGDSAISPSSESDMYSQTTLISKDLIRGVQLKGSVGVNTSPGLQSGRAGIMIEDTGSLTDFCTSHTKATSSKTKEDYPGVSPLDRKVVPTIHNGATAESSSSSWIAHSSRAKEMIPMSPETSMNILQARNSLRPITSVVSRIIRSPVNQQGQLQNGTTRANVSSNQRQLLLRPGSVWSAPRSTHEVKVGRDARSTQSWQWRNFFKWCIESAVVSVALVFIVYFILPLIRT